MPRGSNAAASFYLCPAAANTGIIDCASKEGKKLYEDASRKLCDESFSCDPDEYHDLIQVLSSRAMEWSWDSSIMSVPTDSSNAASPRVSLLLEHGKLSIGQIRQYEKTYIATQTRQAQNTYMLYQALFKSLSKIGRSKIILDKKDYVVHVGGQEYRSGTLLLKVILNKMHLETKAAARGIRQRLSNLDTYIVKIGYDIVKFNKYVKSQMQHLAAKGETTNDLVDNVLNAYEVVPGEDWKAWHRRVTDRIDDGTEVAINDLLEKGEAKYKTLVDNEKWNILSDSEKQIIALKAEIKDLRKNKNSGKKKDTKKPSTRKKREDKYLKLRDTVPKDPKKAVMIDGKKFWWCGKATGGNCEKLVRHHPSKCIASFSTMTPDQRKSALKSGSKSKKLTIKKVVVDDDERSATDTEGGNTDHDEASDFDEMQERTEEMDLSDGDEE